MFPAPTAPPGILDSDMEGSGYGGQVGKLGTFFLYFIEVWLIYNVVLISSVQSGDSVIHIYIYILFYILFHYGLSQKTGYSSLFSTVGPC